MDTKTKFHIYVINQSISRVNVFLVIPMRSKKNGLSIFSMSANVDVTWKDSVAPHWFWLCIVEQWNTEIVSWKYPKNVCYCYCNSHNNNKKTNIKINVPQSNRKKQYVRNPHREWVEVRRLSLDFISSGKTTRGLWCLLLN